MKTKHRKTLTAIYKKPTQGSIIFTDIEALVKAIGGEVREAEGSRIAFELNSTCKYLHRPHPGKEARKYQVEDLREWLSAQGVLP